MAEELGIKRPSADYRLRQLEEDEKITKDMIGNSLAWSVTEEA